MPSSLKIVPVRNFSDFYQALHLVHDEYCRSGLMSPRRSGLRVFLRDFLPVSTTFVTLQDKRVVGTATAQLDGAAGLPCDPIYPEKLRELRRLGRRVLESTKFACCHATPAPKSGLGNTSIVGAGLLRALFHWCLRLSVQDWIIVVHPRVKSFYQESLGFELLGEVCECSHVQGNPGVLLRLRIDGIRDGSLQLPEPVRPLLTVEARPDGVGRTYLPQIDEIATILLADSSIQTSASTAEVAALLEHFPGLAPLLERKPAQDENLPILDAMQEVYGVPQQPSGPVDGEAATAPFALRGMLSRVFEVFELRAGVRGVKLSCRVDDSVPDGIVADRQALLRLFSAFFETILDAAPRKKVRIKIKHRVIDGFRIVLRVFADGAVSEIPGALRSAAAAVSTEAELVIHRSSSQSSSLRMFIPVQPFSEALHLTLPAGARIPAKNSQLCAGGLDVLVVEDSYVSASLTKRLLTNLGHRVAVSHSAEECLKRLEKGRFDLILMDIQLPGMNGLEVTRQIRSIELGDNRQVCIYALSALVMKDDQKRCMASGMDGYLSKPVEPRQLEALLVQLTERKRLRSSALIAGQSALILEVEKKSA
ncbi:MAG: response regulator [Oligoflexia bacterium]|nr:response regulator [Oligoflexia bacterium]